MTVVLADGEIVPLCRRTDKGVTGYDLTSLLVGSEGTLGIITDVTVRLRSLAGREKQAIIGYFPTLRLAGDAVAVVTEEDVCVPRHAVSEGLAGIQSSATEHDVVIANIAHA